MWFDQAAVRVRAGRKPDRGNPGGVPDWSPSAVGLADLPPLNIQPRVQDEGTEADRSPVITGWRIQADHGVDLDVTAQDRIEWDGLLLEVDGEIARWPDPVEGGLDHVEFNVVRVTG
ncbi:hypothetical protein OG413_15550 [Streptomyces sp. NBC_01433]|uniref:hypothetical protein n=1 Tax=Streptomyces sp. NBC_01433 TaxID=2903864 RepID=UPI0022579996|nr:hypothetical protein [Streptomyces sp. NBC_01433]MCX4676699.1 hypothetical protein [Streptomyces sp. NBC_01433]